MTYRAEFEGAALVQLNGLPPAVFDALVEGVVALVHEPWDAELMAPGNNPAYRQVTFGEGFGLLSFHVNDAIELIRIFDITWIGNRRALLPASVYRLVAPWRGRPESWTFCSIVMEGSTIMGVLPSGRL